MLPAETWKEMLAGSFVVQISYTDVAGTSDESLLYLQEAASSSCPCTRPRVLVLCRLWKEAFSSHLGVQVRISTSNEKYLGFLTKNLTELP